MAKQYIPTYVNYQQPKPVFKLGDTNVWGGSLMRAAPGTAFTAKIVLDYSLVEEPVVEVRDDTGIFNPELASPSTPQLILDWRDGAYPPLSYDWWLRLHENIRAFPAGSRVLIGCHGGTGRTGTALSILYGIEFPAVAQPVDEIRTLYKYDAVETKAQRAYIEAILGKDITSIPSYDPEFYAVNPQWGSAWVYDGESVVPREKQGSSGGGRVTHPRKHLKGS